jgi:LuxR family maltose regulon positive regulatory protein
LGRQSGDDEKLNEAEYLLTRILEAAENAGWIHETIKALILKSIAYSSLGKTQGAIDALMYALKLAQSGGYIRIFLDEDPLLFTLLEQLQEHDEVGQYAIHLLTCMEADEDKRKQGEIVDSYTSRDPLSQLVEGLSEREMEVLQLLRTRMTSTEIAEMLSIAVSTVRSHIKSIYSKLDVHSRVEVVQKAEELGLF